jgi:hypothetical protein
VVGHKIEEYSPPPLRRRIFDRTNMKNTAGRTAAGENKRVTIKVTENKEDAVMGMAGKEKAGYADSPHITSRASVAYATMSVNL